MKTKIQWIKTFFFLFLQIVGSFEFRTHSKNKLVSQIQPLLLLKSIIRAVFFYVIHKIHFIKFAVLKVNRSAIFSYLSSWRMIFKLFSTVKNFSQLELCEKIINKKVFKLVGILRVISVRGIFQRYEYALLEKIIFTYFQNIFFYATFRYIS